MWNRVSVGIGKGHMEHYSIWADGLTKTYTGGGKKGKETFAAVDNIHLQVAPGEFYGFLGPNGAGKSTAIRMLTGLLRPTAGRIVIAGHDIQAEPLEVRRHIGVLAEEPSLYERLTATEFLMFAGQMYGLSRSEAQKRSADLLELMELSGDEGKLIVDFSMGMRKKIAIAGALIHSPKVLFLDEPFNGIDAVSGRAIRDVLQRMTAGGTTVFFSSHVMEVVQTLCTRVAIIVKGNIVAEGTLDDLRTHAGEASATLEDLFVQLVSGTSGEKAQAHNEDLSWLGS